MTARPTTDSDGSDDDLILNTTGLTLEPFQFEPEFTPGELVAQPDAQDSSSGSELEGTQGGDDHMMDRVGNTDWCLCENCGAMGSAQESVCCRENPDVGKKLENAGLTCIIYHGEFLTITKRVVLENTLWLLHNARGDPFDPEDHRALRYAGYRQFIAWVYGKLGRKVRKIIPSCVVNHIRTLHPNHPGEDYVGFKEVDSD